MTKALLAQDCACIINHTPSWFMMGLAAFRPTHWAKPAFEVYKLLSFEQWFLLFCSKGLSDVVNNQEACDIVHHCLNSIQQNGQGPLSSEAGVEAVATENAGHSQLSRQRTAPSRTSLGAAPLICAGPNPSDELGPSSVAAAVVTKAALARGSRDNISVIVVDLRARS
jgi:hypothetical protein